MAGLAESIETQVRERAYFLWEQDGRPEGQSVEYWAKARREIEDAAGPASSVRASPAAATSKQPEHAETA